MLPSTLPLDLLARIRAALPRNVEVYLVGGAVRDVLLSRPIHDLDFILSGNVTKIGRRLANTLGTAFYPLDTERDTVRLIMTQPDGSRQFLDFATPRGPDLESDLHDRDLTINAMAMALEEPYQLIDPLGGAQDLKDGRLRACSNTAFTHDPVRILRAIRQAADLGFYILPETRQLMRQAIPGLERISPERLRDELFRILDGPRPSAALGALDILGVLPYVLPELLGLKNIHQSSPHIYDVWTHSLNTLQRLDDILDALDLQQNPETTANWSMGLISLRLGRYRQQLHDHLNTPLNPERSLRALLLFAALYHDTGKPAASQVEENGRVRFIGHELSGVQMIRQRAGCLRLSNHEIERLDSIVRYHMRPLLLAQGEQPPTRRAIYRFFRDTGSAGVDICWLSLADTLATYGPELPQDVWTRQLDTVRALLEAYWENAQEQISPPPILRGDDLIQDFNMSQGPKIGELLDALHEAQVTGDLHSREEALAFARTWLEAHHSEESPSQKNNA